MVAPRWGPLSIRHGQIGLVFLVVGEALIVIRFRPISDFYFPLVWLGYILILDATLYAHTRRSLFVTSRATFALFLPMSIAFWWLFELFNLAVHNWSYVGASRYTGVSYVLFASMDFSLVLLAVWSSARFVNLLLPAIRPSDNQARGIPLWVLCAIVSAGVVALILPVLWPRYFFGLIWVSLLFLLDPINYRLGRPSMLSAIWQREWRAPVSFALGALMCGFFWEAWNFWSLPRWVYHIPFVGFRPVFEMPLLGWTGYLPFGLELFAMTNFVLALLRQPGLALEPDELAGSAPRDEHAFEHYHYAEKQHA